mmetsp:Transcript_23325/g.43426  ORF Transcript_23325/g.43426 Transcript_23325/m.43426 type:complete len:247 (-) Transcript_23325:145-885(-)
MTGLCTCVIGITGGAAVLALVRWKHVRRQHHGVTLARRYRDSKSWRNVFCVVRHGQSEANVAKVISSSPDVGTVKHTLTEVGREQAAAAGKALGQIAKDAGAEGKIVVYCSDFLRTRCTAEIAAQELGIKKEDITLRTELRERFFGSLDGQSDANYKRVWEHDKDSIFHQEFGCESVASVVRRAGDLVLELDSKHEGCVIALVCHGDIAQILRTAFDGPFPPAKHRFGESLATGSVTRFHRTPLQW